MANLPRVARWHGDRWPRFLMQPEPGLPPRKTGLGLGVRGWRCPARRPSGLPGAPCSFLTGVTHHHPTIRAGAEPEGPTRAEAGPAGARREGQRAGTGGRESAEATAPEGIGGRAFWAWLWEGAAGQRAWGPGTREIREEEASLGARGRGDAGGRQVHRGRSPAGARGGSLGRGLCPPARGGIASP